MGVAGAMEAPNTGLSKAMQAVAEKFPRLGKYITAYHGSPHDFERFDASKIGAGEGAQVYGHGLYFAENPTTARVYQNKLGGPPEVTVGGEPLRSNLLAFDAKSTDETVAARIAQRTRALRSLGHEPTGDGTLAMVQSDIENGLIAATNSKDFKMFQALSDQKLALQRMREAGVNVGSSGKMYEVGIKADPEHFLDWDKPFNQQSEHVQEALRRLGVKEKPHTSWQPHFIAEDDLAYPKDHRGNWTSVQKDAQGRLEGWAGQSWGTEAAAQRISVQRNAITPPGTWRNKGEHLYADMAGTPAERSQRLRDAGITGVRYLDQGSRSAGEGTSNYVVFDDQLIDILKKYGLPLTTAAGLLQQQRAGQPSKD